MRCFPLCCLGLVLLHGAAVAQTSKGPLVLIGARIYTAAGAPIENGILVIKEGKIEAIVAGKDAGVRVPLNASARNLSGKVIIPGMVDTHSHIGIYPRPHVPANQDGNEMTGPAQPGLRALDAIYPDDPGIRMAVAGGITTANIMPGSGNVIGGQTVYVKLRGRTIEDMRLANAGVLGGLKMANGENPKGYGRRQQAPGTRMKLAALQREQFVKARDYQQKWAAYRKANAAGKELPAPETDLSLEPLVEVLDGKRTVHFHSHRADDLMTALRIAQEFGFEIVLHHATEGYRIADELARRKVPVSLTLVDSPGGKLEAAGLLEENAAILDKAGVNIAINTDDFITESRFFLRTGAIAVRGGMSEDAALRALTINPARMLHLENRVGSLEPGKDADFVVLSGPPFSVYTQVLETYIDGVRVFDRSQKKDWTYQAGGFALADQSRLPKPPATLKPLSQVSVPVAVQAAPSLQESPTRFAVFAGRIETVSNGTIEDGAILVEEGKIRYVGARADLKLPEKTPVLTTAVVTPGLIDTHTVVPTTGLLNIPADQEQDEMSDPNQADVRVLDGFNPNEPLLQFLREQGVTVIQAMPGRANVIAGQGGVFRTHGRTAEQMTLRFPSSILINLGEIPKTSYAGKLPGTRMGTASLVRTAFSQAANNRHKRLAAKDEDKHPPHNLKLEALELALNKKVPVYFSAHRADDLDTSLRLANEFNLKAVLDLATEGYLIADIIAAAKVPVVVHPTMQRAGASMETYNSHLCNAAILADHHIPIAIGTSFEGYVPKTRVLRHEAAVAMVNGLGFDRALRSITLDAAHLLGIDARFGSLEVGKEADLVLYDGDPFENTTHVTQTVIGGRVVYDRVEYLKLPFERRALPLAGGGVGCCMGIW
ncbi:MAG TPA: amidohydrolase family protein [Gemmataceae bacterium]|jgi:imidazolonepropionase-like amidohydrolase|nr:amidohydrolase family protein [Gemmataceae bacterium]